jgi:2-polyprenyl-3-methyl-5-hydroxy-6-metoxy-1,4-benzoquinol methylase
MLSNLQKLTYFFEAITRYHEPVKCTYCGSAHCRLIDRKYIVTRLFECNNCHIYFRHPVEKLQQNKSFYQNQYQEQDNMTALLPTSSELEEIKKTGFVKGNKNAGRYNSIFKKIMPEQERISVIDYGCSWGYISWQLKQFGYDVQSFEISQPRANYGNEQLDLAIVTDEGALKPGSDIFFSSHVIEHHPAIAKMIDLSKKLVKPGGYFVAISPNGSAEFRKKNPIGFSKAWGKVHPHYLNVEFYKTIFKEKPYYIGSSPFNFSVIKQWKSQEQIIDELSGDELIVITRY